MQDYVLNKQLRKSLFPGGDDLHWLHGGVVKSIVVDIKIGCFVLIKSSVGRCAGAVRTILILRLVIATLLVHGQHQF